MIKVSSAVTKQKRSTEEKSEVSTFSFRVRIGEHEIEISGSHEEVMKTIDQLPKIMPNVSSAFQAIRFEKGKVEVSSTVQKVRGKGIPLPYPKIPKTKSCKEAVLHLLRSDWGRWRPRTLNELLEGLRANALNYPASSLSSVLVRLVRKGVIRRWKTEEGYVYILAEKEED